MDVGGRGSSQCQLASGRVGCKATHQVSESVPAMRWLSQVEWTVALFSQRARADLSRVVAVTAVSPSVAQWQLELSQQIASQVAVEHWVVETHEISLPEYQRNDSRGALL